MYMDFIKCDERKDQLYQGQYIYSCTSSNGTIIMIKSNRLYEENHSVF